MWDKNGGKGMAPTKQAVQETIPRERRTVTVPEAGAQLGISRNAAYEAVKRGEIPALRLGRRLVVSKAVIDRLLEARGE